MLSSLSADHDLRSPPSGLPAPVGSGPSETLAGKRVVIVEDEGIAQMQLRHILSHAGLTVVGSAGNGQQGVEVVLRERPDLVLMDIRMPVMDGLEATRRILDVYRVCIVILTAFSDEEYWDAATGMGVCGYILKPIHAEVLLPKLASVYQLYHAPDEPSGR
jgi:response regulator NasT